MLFNPRQRAKPKEYAPINYHPSEISRTTPSMSVNTSEEQDVKQAMRDMYEEDERIQPLPRNRLARHLISKDIIKSCFIDY